MWIGWTHLCVSLERSGACEGDTEAASGVSSSGAMPDWPGEYKRMFCWEGGGGGLWGRYTGPLHLRFDVLRVAGAMPQEMPPGT